MTSFAPKGAEKKETSGHQHTQSAPITEEEQFAHYEAIPDIRLVHADPRVLSPDTVLHLQRILGNQTVQRLLVNRDQDQAPAADTDPPGPAHRSYSDDELAEIFGEFMAEETPEVPTYEVIAGSTGAETSRGEVETRAEDLWTRRRVALTEGARQAASSPPASDQTIPTQSPEMPVASGQPYDLRWSISYFAWDYQSSNDLPDIRDMLRARSPFRRALDGEFSNTIEVENPTAEDIVSRTQQTLVQMMMVELDEGQIGELVVTFSGHGSNGAMVGVDEQHVEPFQLTEIGELARRNGIHVVFIMDMCYAGRAVSAAQETAATELRDRVDAMPGDQSTLLDAMDVVDDLVFDLHEVNNGAFHLADANRNHGGVPATFHSVVVTRMNELNSPLSHMGPNLNRLAGLVDFVGSDELMNVLQHHQTADVYGDPAVMPSNQGAVTTSLRHVADLVDVTNDVVNRIIQQVNARVNAAPGSGAGGAGDSPSE